MADPTVMAGITAEIHSRIGRCVNAHERLLLELIEDERVSRQVQAELERITALTRSIMESSSKSQQQGWRQIAQSAGKTSCSVTIVVSGEPFRLSGGQLSQPALRGSRLSMVADSEFPVPVQRQPAAFRLVYRFLLGEMPAGKIALRVLLNELDWWRIESTLVREKLLA